MNRFFAIAGVLAVAATVLPAGALATWYSAGQYEPDTTYDVEGGFVHENPNVDPNVEQVYFNVYPTEYQTAVNPNVGATGSRVYVAGERYYLGTLGVWKDCNGDNYIGLAESAAWSYSTLLLPTNDICPEGTLHNDGEWVHEIILIGRGDGASAPYIIVDNESAVWGDLGAPGSFPTGTCPIYPMPHGTTSGTGALIRYADCFVGKQATGAVNQNDPTGQLAFDDQNNPQRSDSLLNQHFPVNLFGNPTTCQTGAMQRDEGECTEETSYAFRTYDCDSTPATVVPNPTGPIPIPDPTGELSDDGTLATLFPNESGLGSFILPAPSTDVNPSGSFANGFNNTVDGAEGCGDDNDYDDAHDQAQFFLDGEHEGNTQNPQKYQPDIGFGFFDGASSALGVNAICPDEDLLPGVCTPRAGLDTVGGPTVPASLGLNPGAHQLLGPKWSAGVVYLTTPQSVSRTTLQPQSGIYTTFYAKIGSATTSLGYAGLGQGEYGSEICQGNYASDSDPNDGWQCNADLWYVNPVTGENTGTPTSIRVGQAYQFRDVDCDDGSIVRGVPVYASLVAISANGPCVDA